MKRLLAIIGFVYGNLTHCHAQTFVVNDNSISCVLSIFMSMDSILVETTIHNKSDKHIYIAPSGCHIQRGVGINAHPNHLTIEAGHIYSSFPSKYNPAPVVPVTPGDSLSFACKADNPKKNKNLIFNFDYLGGAASDEKKLSSHLGDLDSNGRYHLKNMDTYISLCNRLYFEINFDR